MARNAAIVVLVLAALVVTLQVSVAGALRETRPQLALNWMPFDSQSRAKLAVLLMENRENTDARELGVQLAQDALRRDILTPVALRALALAEDDAAPGLTHSALALIQAAETVSRRDQATQVALIGHALSQGRAVEAMLHFDMALRTSWSSQQRLFPLMANAMADQGMADALIERLRLKPIWSAPFLRYIVEQDPEPIRANSLTREFLDPNHADQLRLISTHLSRLAAVGEYDRAWRTYNHFALSEGETGAAVRNGSFEQSNGVPPFDWSFADEPDLWAVVQADPSGHGNVLGVAAISGRTGEVARQLVRLSPGSYRASAQFGNVPDDLFERPELRIDCAARPRAVLRMKPVDAGTERRSESARFTIPAGCQYLWVAVAVAGDASEGDGTPWIDNIQLSPVGN